MIFLNKILIHYNKPVPTVAAFSAMDIMALPIVVNNQIVEPRIIAPSPSKKGFISLLWESTSPEWYLYTNMRTANHCYL